MKLRPIFNLSLIFYLSVFSCTSFHEIAVSNNIFYRTKNVIYRDRYLFLAKKITPLSSINNKSIKLIQEKNYEEALFLLKQISINKLNGCYVLNNIAVANEFLGKIKDAFNFYSLARKNQPNNFYIRENFFYFVDSLSILKNISLGNKK